MNNIEVLILQIAVTLGYLFSFIYFNIVLGLQEKKFITITQMSCNFIILVVALTIKHISNGYILQSSKEDRRKLELSLTYESLELYPICDIEKSSEPSILKGDL